ncbi:hypothetical protein BGZ58_006648 [Dissophora ornata]|nr:hypothetical protein BGZ58_006648 [Dissophora ornata]
MTKSEIETQEVAVVAVDAIVPEGAVITPEPVFAHKPESEQAADEPVTTEESDAVVPEVEATVAPKLAPVKQSRLSLAFHKISCGKQ